MEKKLKQSGFDVLLDRLRLKPGQQWRQEIHTWMSRCHGAVILFSKNAYEDSDWVLKEATILSWRRALDPAFLLIPVLLPPVVGPMLSKGDYEPLALGETQSVNGKNPAAALKEILAELLPLKKEQPETPLDWVLAFVGEKLQHIKPATLKNIAVKLGKPIVWKGNDTAGQFAREILHVDLARVKDVMRELQPFVSADALKIVNYLAPFCIDPVVAAPVARIALREPDKPPREAVSLNASEVDIGELHIQRARSRLQQWRVIPVTVGGGADQAGSILRQIRAAFQQIPHLGGLRPALLKGTLADYRKDGDPYFILIQKYVAPLVLQKLRDAYPDCTFMVLSGKTATDAYRKKGAGVRLLKPPLERDAEDKLIVQLMSAREIAERDRTNAR